MNAVTNALHTLNDTLQGYASDIDHARRHDPILVAYYGANHDYAINPKTYDDLGARIVARTLAADLHERANTYERHGFPILSRIADSAAFELDNYADGMDQDTIAQEREETAAYEERGNWRGS